MNRKVILASLFLILLSSQSFSAQLYPVVEVKDGDSIVVLYRGKNEEVHLIGVDAPEIARPPRHPAEPLGNQAKAFTNNILSGKAVRLVFEQDQRNKDGMLSGYLQISADKVTAPPACMVKSGPKDFDFNASLISCGYARVPARAQFTKMDQYRKLEAKARSSRIGLWKSEPSPAKQIKKEAKKEAAKKPRYYIGDKSKREYHRPDCQKVKRIRPGQRTEFSSKEEARKEKYRPCKICKP